MELLAMMVFALAVSADGFGVGIAYGVRNITIPFLSLTVICLASMLVVSLSMLLGQGIACYMSPGTASWLGAVILMGMGAWVLLQAFRSEGTTEDDGDVTIFSFRIRPLGIIVQILREPARADFDCSGEISTREAFFLGIALAMDALAAGMGVAMAGYSIVMTALLVGAAKFILVNSGVWLGKRVSSGIVRQLSTVAAGAILVCLGLVEIL